MSAGTTLASQSLILAPGDYALSSRGQVSPGDNGAMWVLSCQTSNQPLVATTAATAIAASVGGNPGVLFTVPPESRAPVVISELQHLKTWPTTANQPSAASQPSGEPTIAAPPLLNASPPVAKYSPTHIR